MKKCVSINYNRNPIQTSQFQKKVINNLDITFNIYHTKLVFKVLKKKIMISYNNKTIII